MKHNRKISIIGAALLVMLFAGSVTGRRQVEKIQGPQATLDGRAAFVYVLIEHQSSPDPMMPLRMLRYVMRIWERWTTCGICSSIPTGAS